MAALLPLALWVFNPCQSALTESKFDLNFDSKFDYLGLEVFQLTPEEKALSNHAAIISAKNLQNLEIQPKNPKVPHHRSKRGENFKNPGYYALPIPPLPSNIDESKTRLLTRPNKKLIRFANQISRRQGVLPPAVNYNSPKELPGVDDPFHLMPPPSSNIYGDDNYPNSIQDVLHQVDQLNSKPPSDDSYPPVYDPPDPLEYPPFTHKPQTVPTTQKPKKKRKKKKKKKKKVVYKVVNTEAPHVENGTTKKTIYKLVTEKPKKVETTKKYHQVVEKTTKKYHEPTTKKPEIMYHTRKPITVDQNDRFKYDHNIPPEPFPAQKPPQNPHKPPSKPATKPEDYMAVIPYGDVYKLFEMLNKHTQPYDDKKMQKKVQKMKKMKKTTTPLPHPTTKRTKLLQPKVVKRTRLKGYKKKKKKKVVHVSHTQG